MACYFPVVALKELCARANVLYSKLLQTLWTESCKILVVLSLQYPSSSTAGLSKISAKCIQTESCACAYE